MVRSKINKENFTIKKMKECARAGYTCKKCNWLEVCEDMNWICTECGKKTTYKRAVERTFIAGVPLDA